MSSEDPLSQGAPGRPARGRGPSGSGEPSQRPYKHPTAGWGAAREVGKLLFETREPVEGARATLRMNHENGGFDCPGCAWPDDRHNLHLDICENGVKHVTWEMTHKRVDRRFFAEHTVTELSSWPDHDLEDQGRLTEPMVYDPGTDTYVPIGWRDAFTLVGDTLRGLDSPDDAAFYTSGRLGNEASFLYQLWVREFGTNNLPDCSNMCHEASGRALTAAIGTGKGTVALDDWDHTDALFILGVNAASNAPRMLTSLAKAYRRGARIVHVNPLVEAAAKRTIVPHEFLSMATLHATRTGTLNVQPRIGGDMALIRGVAKAVIAAGAVDHEFVDRYTHGFAEYARLCEQTSWPELERQSGVPQAMIHQMARVYLGADRAIVAWCLGLTQQDHAVDSIREIVNLMLLRGHIGRDGAGLCPIRGHSNVQGNRTCGIDHRPGDKLLDRLAEVCGIDPPREHGLGTVATVEAMHQDRVKVFVGMGGNFALAAPDTAYTFEALRRCDLTVHVSTKLNRSHLVHGKKALILPCLGRSEKDRDQSISVEDSMSMVHLSTGMKRAASPYLLSEVQIIAGLAQATLPGTAQPWAAYATDYDLVRDTMARVLDGFEDFNRRVRQPLGFRLAQPARERVFTTPSGRAEFSTAALPDVLPPEGRLTLSTMRSHDQWNTTIYSGDDRYRGIRNLRTLILMHPRDMRERGLAQFDLVDVTSFARDGSTRSVYGYRVVAYNIPPGNVAGYMPELNALCPISDVSSQSEQPLTKHLIVQVTRARAAKPAAKPAASVPGGG
ncbi:FdhF/YdeP family oxidoreductase [Nonomuraea sp. NBC_01738]|uniref:FdhF/YdeP family oxidoreductase n=1 Tax=Nonomuraea sp. NBC_01738 TaxID=2976003 RepID=UPI002E12E3DB|nr:FdhF/YdeP family oxidoreductase [Nonomuraea sp. NBC_01738]